MDLCLLLKVLIVYHNRGSKTEMRLINVILATIIGYTTEQFPLTAFCKSLEKPLHDSNGTITIHSPFAHCFLL